MKVTKIMLEIECECGNSFTIKVPNLNFKVACFRCFSEYNVKVNVIEIEKV